MSWCFSILVSKVCSCFITKNKPTSTKLLVDALPPAYTPLGN